MPATFVVGGGGCRGSAARRAANGARTPALRRSGGRLRRRGDELVADGSYLQFLHGGTLMGRELVYVGTRDGLVDVFSEEADRLQMSILGGGRGLLDPGEFVDKFYGYGRAAFSRQVLQDRDL